MNQDVLSPEQAAEVAAWWRQAFEALREQARSFTPDNQMIQIANRP